MYIALLGLRVGDDDGQVALGIHLLLPEQAHPKRDDVLFFTPSSEVLGPKTFGYHRVLNHPFFLGVR